MFSFKDLKKLRIVFKKSGKAVGKDFFDSIIEKAPDKDLRNFLIGCRHTVERHYTEALKWFQISGCEDSKGLIVLLSYKLGDDFLMEQYYSEDIDIGKTLNKLGLELYISIDNKEYKVDGSLLKNLCKI